MEHINTTQNTNTDQQPATTPTPEETGDQGGAKLFTQDEVNRIVSERLARERAKMEPSPADVRESQLKARESRLDCRDYLESLAKSGKAASGVVGLLDILDTSDPVKFQATVTALLTLGAFNPQLEPLVIPPADRQGPGVDQIAAAFKPKPI